MRDSKNKTKKTITPKILHILPQWFIILASIVVVLYAATWGSIAMFDAYYQNKTYPNVYIGGKWFGDKTKDEIATYWREKNEPFASAKFELRFNSTIATVSGSDIDLGYDADLSATQAYLIGRSDGILSNLYTKFFQKKVDLQPYFRWKENVINDLLDNLSEQIDIPVENALFTFSNNKVTAFKPSKNGLALNRPLALERIQQAFLTVAKTDQQYIRVNLPVDTVKPDVSTGDANRFGIKELIASGYSEFEGSIPGRIHNVALAADRLNGVLIKPGDTFSFDDAVGDISAATGYQSAYIIKDGHTVLGDGGGVCQVSTTLFRAALNAGLPIVERHAHDYRVHYYEEGGFKPGLDATVYSPSVDLKFKNDTPGYILIQTKTDTANLNLTFDLYGTNDGRVAQISNQKLWGVTPPPPDLYQDDPTIPKGTIKQVDFSAWGAKASFDYMVKRGAQTLEQTTFYSNFQPWQAVYLRGTL